MKRTVVPDETHAGPTLTPDVRLRTFLHQVFKKAFADEHFEDRLVRSIVDKKFEPRLLSSLMRCYAAWRAQAHDQTALRPGPEGRDGR